MDFMGTAKTRNETILTDRDPDIRGPRGEAWRILDPSNSNPACVRAYIVRASGYHPHWSRWLVSAVHLRPVKGQAANFQFQEATHEFLIATFGPEGNITLINGPGGVYAEPGAKIMSPFDVCKQFVAPNDRWVAGMVMIAVENIINHNWSPDRDFRPHWVRWLESSQNPRGN